MKKYTIEQRLDIGRRIYEGELTKYQAANIYGICDDTARQYMRLYRDKSKYEGLDDITDSIEKESSGRLSREERLDIGRRIYEDEITRYQASVMYGISDDTARTYMRHYRDINNLPPKKGGKKSRKNKDKGIVDYLEEYENMSKEELIKELIRMRVAEAL